MTGNFPLAVSSVGGPFDVIYGVEDDLMGFITEKPADINQVSPFAIAIRTGGEAAYSNDTYQQSIFNGFNEGGDRDVFESSDRRYQWSDGQVALHVEDRVTLASMWESSDAAQVATAREIIDFNASTCPQPWIVYACGKKLRAFNTTTQVWADARPAAGEFAQNIKHIYNLGAYLVISFGSALNSQLWTGATLTTGYSDSTVASDVTIKGTIYTATQWRGLGGNLYKYIAAWGAAIPVGDTSTSITDLFETGGLVFIAKPEGFFTYNDTTVSRLIDTEVVQSINNCRGLTEWMGAMYIPWLNAIHKGAVSSSTSITSTDITPDMKGDTAKERYGHGIPIKFIAGPRKMYIAFDDGEGLYPEVLSYDGIGYQQTYRGTSGDTMYALGYSRQMDYLLINDGATRIKKLINNGDSEYPNFAATGEFWTPALDGGFPSETKAYRSIALTTEDCLAGKEKIDVYYRLDGGAWVLADTIETNGILQEVILSAEQGHVVGKKIEFKFVLTRTTGVTSTPKIKMPMVVRLLALPMPIDAYSETIDIKDSTRLRNGYGPLSGDGYSVQDRVDFLLYARNSPYPITRVDEWGRVAILKITSMGQVPTRKGGDSDEGSRVALDLINLAPGVNSWIITFTSSKANGGTITPAMTLATGAPTPEWKFTNPDGTTATYTTASCTHTVAGTGITTFTLGPTSLYPYVTTLDINTDNLTGTISQNFLTRLPRLEELYLYGNASLICYFPLSALPAMTMEILDIKSTSSIITGSLADLPSTMKQLYTYSTSSVISGALSNLPASMTHLALGTTASGITGATTNLPAGMIYLYIMGATNIFTGALSGLPATMEYFHIGSATSSVITGTLASMPASMRQLYLSSTASTVTGSIATLPAGFTYFNLSAAVGCNITGTCAQIPATMIYFVAGGTLSAITGNLSDLPASLTTFAINGTSSNVTGSLSDLKAAMTTLQLYGTASTFTGGAVQMAAVGISAIMVSNMALSQAVVDGVLLRLFTDRMLFTPANPYLAIGGTNDDPGGVYQHTDPPTTGNEYRHDLVNDTSAEGFHKWSIIIT
jgi:hypothetical protein